MTKTKNDNAFKTIDLTKDPQGITRLVGTTAPEWEYCEADFKARYQQGSDEATRMQAALSGVDRRTTIGDALSIRDAKDVVQASFDSSSNDSWRPYVQEMIMQQVLHTTPKRPDYSSVVCPNTVTVTRDPAVYIALDQGTDKATKPTWQFLGEDEDTAKTMHRYLRKNVSLRRYGHGFSMSRELLSDCPLDLLAHRQIMAQSTLIPFKENMLTSALYEATYGEFASTYDNVFECNGTQTTRKDAGGNTDTRVHGISVDDVLEALQQFRSELTPTSDIIGTQARGQNHYTPGVLVLSPKTIADLTIEVWRGGWSTYGPNFDPRNQAQQTAMLSALFGIPVVPLWSVKWESESPETPANWSYVYDGFIVDNDLGPVELAHADGWFLQTWFIDGKRVWCYAQTRRSNYFVQDPKAILRLESA